MASSKRGRRPRAALDNAELHKAGCGVPAGIFDGSDPMPWGKGGPWSTFLGAGRFAVCRSKTCLPDPARRFALAPACQFWMEASKRQIHQRLVYRDESLFPTLHSPYTFAFSSGGSSPFLRLFAVRRRLSLALIGEHKTKDRFSTLFLLVLYAAFRHLSCCLSTLHYRFLFAMAFTIK